MSINITELPTDLSPSYGPNKFEVTQITTYQTSTLGALEVQVYVNNNYIGPTKYLKPLSSLGVGSDQEYYYEFDISEHLIKYFRDINFLPDIGTGDVIADPTFQASVELLLFEWVPDENDYDILKKDGGSFPTPAYWVIDARRQWDEDQTLTEFDRLQGGYPVNHLTRKPIDSLVCLEDSEFLYFWGDGLTAVQVTTFDEVGAQIEQDSFPTGTFGDPYKLICIGVGPLNINNTTIWSGSGVTIDSDVYSYVVKVGTTDTGPFLNGSPIRNYYIAPSDCKEARFHFRNYLGGYDSFTMWNNYIETIQFSSPLFQRAEVDPFQPRFSGVNRVQVVGQQKISGIFAGITLAEMEWLAKDLSLSSDILLEKDGVYYSYYLSDASVKPSDSSATLPEITFEFLASHNLLGLRS